MASVPDTTTFNLQNVTTIVGVNNLSGCFTYAPDAYFDPAYKGYKNNLLNFRNYQEPYINCSPTSVVFHYNGTVLYGGNSVIVNYAKGTYTQSWAVGTHFYYNPSNYPWVITCNGNNTTGAVWTDTLTFHLSVGGLTASFYVTQFFAPN
jgi:hypothetical protein